MIFIHYDLETKPKEFIVSQKKPYGNLSIRVQCSIPLYKVQKKVHIKRCEAVE